MNIVEDDFKMGFTKEVYKGTSLKESCKAFKKNLILLSYVNLL